MDGSLVFCADEVGGLRPAGLYDFDANDDNNNDNYNDNSGYDDDNNNNDDDDNNNVIAYSNDDDDNRSGGLAGRARSRRPQHKVWGWGFNYCSWFFGGGVFWFFFKPGFAGCLRRGVRRRRLSS